MTIQSCLRTPDTRRSLPGTILLDPKLLHHELKNALAILEWSSIIFPDESEARPDSDDSKTYNLEVAETSTILKAIAITSFDPPCTAAKWLWGAEEITVLAFVQDSSLLACHIRGEQIIGEFSLLDLHTRMPTPSSEAIERG